MTSSKALSSSSAARWLFDTGHEAMTNRNLNPETVARAIGVPVERWPGNCHGIALAMLKAKVVTGKDRYGHYHGFIHPDSERFGGRQFTHHGWIERRTTIVDPTRWVFECVEPYIYVGPKDDEDYDFGGNRVKEMYMRPAPPFDPTSGNGSTWELPDDIEQFAKFILGHDDKIVSAGQVMWLANLPLNMLGEFAQPVYEFIVDDVGLPGMIPMDNRREILGH